MSNKCKCMNRKRNNVSYILPSSFSCVMIKLKLFKRWIWKSNMSWEKSKQLSNVLYRRVNVCTMPRSSCLLLKRDIRECNRENPSHTPDSTRQDFLIRKGTVYCVKCFMALILSFPHIVILIN